MVSAQNNPYTSVSLQKQNTHFSTHTNGLFKHESSRLEDEYTKNTNYHG